MTVQLIALAFDALAPNEHARFWAPALGWNVWETHGVGVELVPTDATSFRVMFRPGADDKAGQNRIHFDLTTTSLDDQDNIVAELLAIGARHIDIGQGHSNAHVMLAASPLATAAPVRLPSPTSMATSSASSSPSAAAPPVQYLRSSMPKWPSSCVRLVPTCDYCELPPNAGTMRDGRTHVRADHSRRRIA
jgi:Glyoxalase-like domain